MPKAVFLFVFFSAYEGRCHRIVIATDACCLVAPSGRSSSREEVQGDARTGPRVRGRAAFGADDVVVVRCLSTSS